jgi:putative copper resistance protein D
MAWAGHSGAAPGREGDVQVALDAFHLVAAGAWVGALAPLASLLAVARREAARGGIVLGIEAARRFSCLGVASVGTLLATGLANTWFLVGSLPALMGTDYGRLLVIKLMVVAVMLVVAAFNRFQLVPRLADLGALDRLQRNSFGEVLLGLITIAIVAALGVIEPAIHAEMPMDHVH